MNKKITYSIWAVLLAVTGISLFFAFNSPQKIDIVAEKNISKSVLFMDQVSQCPDVGGVPERFSCLSNLADATEKEADTLAEKLISQAPIRLNEITSSNTGPVPFVYGGADFLTALPEQVKNAQKVKDEYIKSVCNLTSMTIFGGSGMDLEQNACKYYFTEQYLKILKSLEGGLTATE